MLNREMNCESVERSIFAASHLDMQMIELNENQKNYFLITLQYADRLLADSEQTLALTSSASPFRHYAPDVTPAQWSEIEGGIALFRELMRRILEDMDLRPGPSNLSAARSLSTLFLFVDIALEELRSKHMRNYGKLTDGTSQELDGIVFEMRRLIAHINDSLSDRCTD